MNVLVVDVGGNNVKIRASHREDERKLPSGDELTPERMVEQVCEVLDPWSVDVVALGLPGRVKRGRLIDEPANLGPGWVGFNFAAALERPVRIMNDANLQALGCYEGGRMLFLGLGTALGSTLIAEGVVQSLDLGQMRHAEGERLFELLGREGMKRLGPKRWEKTVGEVVLMLKAALMADDAAVGGGNAKELAELPVGVRRGHNRVVVEGGLRLWRDLPDPTDSEHERWRIL